MSQTQKFALIMIPLGIVFLALSGFQRYDHTQAPLYRLSEYGFFTGAPADQNPADGVIPYSLNTPLFSDYARKLRFMKLPQGATVPYNDKDVLEFPVGTTLIKTFYYPQKKGRRLMETRLLIHEEKGWKALAYHWDEDQTDAFLEVAGGNAAVSFVMPNGKKQKFEYSFPDLNQCKGCHSWDGKMQPIGPSARQLNGDMAYASGDKNQLAYLADRDLLQGLPAAKEEIPRAPVWDDPETGSLDARARIWLDINCAHCHNPHGPASTSGFFLDVHQTDPTTIGILKAPVAAGRASGDNEFDIVPGAPHKSILFERIKSDDPGIMMPEVGRKLPHHEGIALIKEWIEKME